MSFEQIRFCILYMYIINRNDTKSRRTIPLRRYTHIGRYTFWNVWKSKWFKNTNVFVSFAALLRIRPIALEIWMYIIIFTFYFYNYMKHNIYYINVIKSFPTPLYPQKNTKPSAFRVDCYCFFFRPLAKILLNYLYYMWKPFKYSRVY